MKSLGKRNGKKLSQIWKLLLTKGVKSPHNFINLFILFFSSSNFTLLAGFFLVTVLLYASVKSCFVSHMQDFFNVEDCGSIPDKHMVRTKIMDWPMNPWPFVGQVQRAQYFFLTGRAILLKGTIRVPTNHVNRLHHHQESGAEASQPLYTKLSRVYIVGTWGYKYDLDHLDHLGQEEGQGLEARGGRLWTMLEQTLEPCELTDVRSPY